ncbi:MAG: hypothetical protein M3N06_08060 [Pseudomonadota bacterium]|nr:hypothetical protein [Pseudomonadota bacterium]
MAGIEELDEEEIVQLKENAQEQVDTLDDQLEERGKSRRKRDPVAPLDLCACDAGC